MTGAKNPDLGLFRIGCTLWRTNSGGGYKEYSQSYSIRQVITAERIEKKDGSGGEGRGKGRVPGGKGPGREGDGEV